MSVVHFTRNAGIAKSSVNEPCYFHWVNDLRLNSAAIYARKASSTENKEIYTVNNNTINDIKLVPLSNLTSDVLTAVVWCERQGLSSLTELHYAEIGEDFSILRHAKLDGVLLSKEHLCVRPMVVDDMLLVSWIDAQSQNVKLNLYSLNSLQPVSKELEIDEYISSNYFNEAQDRTANLTLIAGNNNHFFLQFLLDSGSLCTYQISVSDNILSAMHLFEQGGEKVGFHETLFDADNNVLFTVYSENKINLSSGNNDIYIISQNIFGRTHRVGPQRVNQSSGMYLRPKLIRCNDMNLIFWEGEKLYYIGLNNELNIELPEETLDVKDPAKIMVSNIESLFVSMHTDNWCAIDYGESLFSTKLSI